MTSEFELVEPEAVDGVGDEWEEIDVEDTEADRIARRRDREFSEFRERIKNTERFKLEESVFDEATYAAIYKLVQDDYIDAFGGPISTGKEANVYTAKAGDHTVAVKVYRINASDFKDMRGYLDGDPRFEGIGQDKRKVVMAWVRKEFANLKRAQKAGVRVPNPIAVERNVLVMEYIATDGDRAKRLNEVHIENPETAYEVVREYMCRLHDAGLVHGDLSEYNIIFQEGDLVVIDLGQAVTKHHPNAGDFLQRDCENIAAFFARNGMDVTGEQLYDFIKDDEERTNDEDADGDP